MAPSIVGSLRRPVGSRGFTLIETMFAIGILTVGVMSVVTLIPFTTGNDYRSRIDTTATFVAMRQLEMLVQQPFDRVNFADGADNINVIDTDTTDAVGTGAALVGGMIDFSQAEVDVPAGYRRTFTLAQAAAGSLKANWGDYEVRWNVFQNAAGVKKFVVGAQLNAAVVAAQSGAPLPSVTTVPANVRAVVMK